MGDHAEDRQNDDIHFRMSEVPTQMLHGMYSTMVTACSSVSKQGSVTTALAAVY